MSQGQKKRGTGDVAPPHHESPRPGSRLRQAISAVGHRYDPGDPWNGSRRRPVEPFDETESDEPIITVDLGLDENMVTPPMADASPSPGLAVAIRASRATLVDLRPGRTGARGPVPAVAGGEYGLGSRWGAEWSTSRQGWIGAETGRPVWRPIVATTDQLEVWAIDTYLGVVNSEVAVDHDTSDARTLGAALARARELGIEGLVEEAVERGAHAVLGTSMQYTTVGERLLVTFSGTAVTLRDRA
ncbi:MAG TPA: heavy metal-binding domain-containing protein [Acidimicrobiia bacterium]